MPVLQNVPSGTEVAWYWNIVEDHTFAGVVTTIKYPVWTDPIAAWVDSFRSFGGSIWADPEVRERVPINQRAELRDRLGIAYALYFYP